MSSLLTKLVMAAVTGGALLAAPTLAVAQSGRPNTTTMSCGQVQSLIKQRGGVVLSTGRYTFDRYVDNRSFCQHGEITQRDYVPTRDNNRCLVWRCANPQPWRYD